MRDCAYTSVGLQLGVGSTPGSFSGFCSLCVVYHYNTDQVMEFIHIESTETTMEYPYKQLPCAVLTDYETKGVGRTGPWISLSGNFLCTYFYQKFENALLFFTTAISELLDLKIKWPNDLISDGKKCGGVLSTFDSVQKVGVGINFVQTENYSYLKQKVNFEHLMRQIAEKVNEMNVEDCLKIYLQKSDVLQLKYHGQSITGMNYECQLINSSGEILTDVTSAKDLAK